MGKRELTPAGLLLTAAAEIQGVGLARGCFVDDQGGECVITAMVRQVVPGPFIIPWWESGDVEVPAVYVKAILAVNSYLGWPIPSDVHRGEEQVMAWVDGDAEGTDQVVEVLRQTAALLRFAIATVEHV